MREPVLPAFPRASPEVVHPRTPERRGVSTETASVELPLGRCFDVAGSTTYRAIAIRAHGEIPGAGRRLRWRRARRIDEAGPAQDAVAPALQEDNDDENAR